MEIFWKALEEQIEFDQETNAMAQLLWPYNEAGAYCYLSDLNRNYHGMEDEQLASSFFQIDDGISLLTPNEVDYRDESSTELQNWRKIQADVDVVPAEIHKKKARVQKEVRNSRSKKKQKRSRGESNEEERNAGLDVQSTSSFGSEEITEGGSVNSSSKGSTALNLNGKARAGRGAATDPQSLYARKRRERINERLRILQNLVPNGTKVDISTMLEEAVQYVKFLQIQIKLLSSDELWMYAPLAYNGMNIGLDFMIPTNKL